jgi:electron transfer flavoprotein alpha subunit
MSVLIIAEHEHGTLKGDTAKVVSAAQMLNKDITLLAVGNELSDVALQASKIQGVDRVLVADNADFKYQLAENIADLVVDIAGDYSHILAAATTTGKNFMPRVAALLDKVQISDITDVIDDVTFKRPIYAGNAIATVKSN